MRTVSVRIFFPWSPEAVPCTPPCHLPALLAGDSILLQHLTFLVRSTFSPVLIQPPFQHLSGQPGYHLHLTAAKLFASLQPRPSLVTTSKSNKQRQALPSHNVATIDRSAMASPVCTEALVRVSGAMLTSTQDSSPPWDTCLRCSEDLVTANFQNDTLPAQQCQGDTTSAVYPPGPNNYCRV